MLFPQRRVRWWRPTALMRRRPQAGPSLAGRRGVNLHPGNMLVRVVLHHSDDDPAVKQASFLHHIVFVFQMRKECVTCQSGLGLLLPSCVTTVTPGRLPTTTSRGTATYGSKVSILSLVLCHFIHFIHFLLTRLSFCLRGEKGHLTGHGQSEGGRMPSTRLEDSPVCCTAEAAGECPSWICMTFCLRGNLLNTRVQCGFTIRDGPVCVSLFFWLRNQNVFWFTNMLSDQRKTLP